MISQINIPDFVKWALTQRGYKLDYNGKLKFYNFHFAILDKSIQNKQFKIFLKNNLE